jgi:hypothetical protein
MNSGSSSPFFSISSLFVYSTFLFSLFCVCRFLNGPYGDVHFFSSTMKRCYLRFFHIDLCFSFQFFFFNLPCVS